MLDRHPKKACRICGNLGHYPYQCFNRRKPEERTKGLRPGGKYYLQWQLTRKTWFKQNPPNDIGRYTCYLKLDENCHRTMDKAHTTLDHIKSRSRHPELRFVQENLAPACWPCNETKGSRDLEDIV